MKFNNLFLFLLFINAHNNYSQNVIAEYEIYHDQIEIKENNKDKYNYLEKLHKNKFNYVLKINDSISIFEEKSSIQLPEYKDALRSLSKAKLGLKYTYYENKSKLAFTEFEPNIYVKDTINNKWEYTTETKKIDSLLCYKAILNIEYINRINEIKTKSIIAWYAPNLPYSFAPLNYHGLPGLIVELTFSNNHFVLKKLQTDVSEKELNIKIPSGKLITRKEYIDKYKIE